MPGRSDPLLLPMKSSKGGRDTHRDTHKGGNVVKIQAMGNSNYFIFRQVVLLGVSYRCLKKSKRMPCTHDF